MLRPHTLVNVYFNDPELVQWHQTMAKCKAGTKPTTNHIDSRDEMKCENQHWRLEWSTAEEQAENRIFSVQSKASAHAKKSVGRVQAREWRGRLQQWRTWTGGVADAWSNTLVWMGESETGRHTGHRAAQICKWMNDGKAHYNRDTGKHWEYRLLKHLVKPGYERERWFRLKNSSWWPDGLAVSDMGRIRLGDGAPELGTKVSYYRRKRIGGTNWLIHELMGWAFFGERPSESHTIDHDNKDLDTDGCLSNARSNLLGWADQSQQARTRRKGSRTEAQGKPVVVCPHATGIETEYASLSAAAEAMCTTTGWIRRVCSGEHRSDVFNAWFVPQSDLVMVRSTFSNGKLTLTTEVERWAKIDPVDWQEGGKYFCVRHEKKERSNIADAKPILVKRRKRERM